MSDQAQQNDLVPGTHGSVECFGAVGPFLISRTYHGRGQRIGPHEHSAASLNFVLLGSYGETFRNKSEVHSPDTLLLKPAGAMHANRFDGSDASCLLIEIGDEALSTLVGKATSRTPLVTRDPRLSTLALRILQETQDLNDASSMIAEELSIALFQSMTNRSAITTGASELRAEELLRETYCQPWSLSGVARSVGVHPAHLGRSFRARFGCTVGEFVRHLRVLHVARELRDTEKPIGQIAIEAGFADQSHCTRVFRKLIVESPARFRARVGCLQTHLKQRIGKGLSLRTRANVTR